MNINTNFPSSINPEENKPLSISQKENENIKNISKILRQDSESSQSDKADALTTIPNKNLGAAAASRESLRGSGSVSTQENSSTRAADTLIRRVKEGDIDSESSIIGTIPFNYNLSDSDEEVTDQHEESIKSDPARLSASELKKLGHSAEALKENQYTPKEIRDAGYSLLEFAEAGFSAIQAKEAGYSIEDFKKVGCKAHETAAAGFKPKELAFYYLRKDLVNLFTAAQLKEAGFEARDLQDKDEKVSPRELKELFNCSIGDLIAFEHVTYSLAELAEAFPFEDLAKEFSPKELESEFSFHLPEKYEEYEERCAEEGSEPIKLDELKKNYTVFGMIEIIEGYNNPSM